MQVELYHRESCPFSARVRDYISENDLRSKIKYHDVEEDAESLSELMAMNDDEQVPCLVVDGEPMLESEEIIEWLETNKESLQ